MQWCVQPPSWMKYSFMLSKQLRQGALHHAPLPRALLI
jgi:hypothetical protein